MGDGAARMAPETRRIQYVITAPTGFQAAAGRYRDSLKRLQALDPVQILGSISDDGEKLVVMNEYEMLSIKAEAPGLVIEPNILYKKARHPVLEGFDALAQTASAGNRSRVRVIDGQTGAPIADAVVYVITDPGRKVGLKTVTDALGECELGFRPSVSAVTVIVLPRSGYWSRSLKNVAFDNALEISLQPLPPLNPEVYDWGHEFSGMEDHAGRGGEPVRIAIIDTGICNSHKDVSPLGGSNCVFEEDPSRWFDDEGGHGTHCAGIAGALLNDIGLKGYVPRASIYSYRVFGKDAGGASTFDIVSAIDKAVEDGCDIINMSLSSPVPQTTLRVRTEFAYDRGVLCVAATGNEGSDTVGYPAAFPSVVGVTAFGRFGTYPKDSLHVETESPLRSTDGSCFMANFSNSGPQVDFCAPGVAIRSTVPGGYGVWDGTSMACPQVTAMAALALATHPRLLEAPRDAERVETLLRMLKWCAEPMGFGAHYEGAGRLRVKTVVDAELP